MGRRSINTTKSGKYMNPTDQARKEARKKELKKNKRQRQMVRAAVLKGKDPAQILEEMEKIDEMEYNVFQPSPLNEKVLREKRKKLKETFDRVMRLYHNDDPELWAELKRKEVEYEKKRLKKQQYFESVKSAQSVQIDEIPLPQMTTPGQPTTAALPRVPPPNVLNFPPLMPHAPPGMNVRRPEANPQILNTQKTDKKKKEPPGCPPGPPPNLSSMRELDSDYEDEDIPLPIPGSNKKTMKNDRDEEDSPGHGRKRTFSGQNIDEFMKEIEDVHRQRESRQNDSDSDRSTDDDDDDDDDDEDDDDDDHSSKKKKKTETRNSETDESNSENSDDDEDEVAIPEKGLSIPLPPIPPPPPAMGGLPGGPPPPPIGMPPSMMQFRPPPMRPGMPPHMSGVRMQGPPGRPGMGMPQRLGIRMPPGPPPGMPPNRMLNHQKGGHHNLQQQQPKPDSKGVTTITAKPQIRNLSADVTRFVPSALRVRRDEHKQHRRPKPYLTEMKPNEPKTGATKDDAYMQFMQEMQSLL